MSGRHIAAEDSGTAAVTHLAPLGVKKQETAFRGLQEEELLAPPLLPIRD